MRTRSLALAPFLVAPSLIAWASGLAPAASISLVPARDNTLIQQTNPNAQLSNGLGDLFSGRTNQDGQNPPTISIRRSLVYFDVASLIPSGSTITSVSLTMRDVMGLNGNRVTTLHRALADWGEGTSFQAGGMGSAATFDDATWLYRFFRPADPTSSAAWTNPGGDFDPMVSGAATILVGNPNGPAYTWSGAGMIADVQSWLDNPAANFGWLVRGDESEGQTAKRLVGSTMQFGPSGNQVPVPNPNGPVLLITYHAIPEPGTAIFAWLATFSILIIQRPSR